MLSFGLPSIMGEKNRHLDVAMSREARESIYEKQTPTVSCNQDSKGSQDTKTKIKKPKSICH
jgi:hypothetical protein